MCKATHLVLGLGLLGAALGSVTVSWTLATDNSTITFTARGDGVSGWIGLGFASSTSMIGSDIIWARNTGSGVEVEDAYATQRNNPQRDTSQDISVVSAALDGSSIVIEVTRPVNSPDNSRDLDLDLNNPQYLQTAWSSSTAGSSFNTLQKHQGRDSRLVNWYAERVLPSSSPTATATATVSRSLTASASVSPSLSSSTSITPSNTPTISITPSNTPTISVTASVTPSPATLSVTPSWTPSSSLTPSTSLSASRTASGSLSPSVSTSTSPTPSLTRSPSTSPLAEGVAVSWVIADDNSTITFSVRASAISGWVGIGVSNDNLMANTDVLWARGTGSGVEVEDAFAVDRYNPERDTSQDVTVVSAELDAGSIVLQLTRPVVSSDTSRDIDIDLDGPQFMFTAYSKSQGSSFSSLSAHDQNLETFEVSWLSGTSTKRGNYKDPKWQTHGILMTVAWGVLIPLGIVVARFGKRHKQWFNFHRINQTIAVVLALAGLYVAVDMTSTNHLEQKHNHGKIGVAVVAIGALQPLVAFVRPHDKTTATRRMWYVVHAGLGVVGVVLGWVNCFSGLELYDSPSAVRLALLAFVLVLSAGVVGMEVHKFVKRCGGGGASDKAPQAAV